MPARPPLVLVPARLEAPPPDTLVEDILALPVRLDILLLADPATVALAKRLARAHDPVQVLEVPPACASGEVCQAACRWALDEGYGQVLEMGRGAAPGHLPVLLAEMDGADLVVGSRFAAEEGRSPGGLRRALGAAGNLLARAALGLSIRDITSGLRLYRSALLECMPWDDLPHDGDGLRVSMVYHAERMGARVREVPVDWDGARPRLAWGALGHVVHLALRDRLLGRGPSWCAPGRRGLSRREG